MATFATVVDPTLNANSAGWNGYTIRQWFASGVLSNTGLAQVRVTFRSSSTQALTVSKAYIGMAAASGDAWDFQSTPVQLLFSGGASLAISANSTGMSDAALFQVEASKNLIVSMYIGGGTSVDDVRTVSGLGGDYVAYYKVADDADTVDATGYATGSGIVYAVDLVEAAALDVVAGASPIFFA